MIAKFAALEKPTTQNAQLSGKCAQPARRRHSAILGWGRLVLHTSKKSDAL